MPLIQTMTLTNYTGVERELVKDMIHLTGISYTGHLSRDTSYLICKRSLVTHTSSVHQPLVCVYSASGKKYEKAVEWGVTVINASFLADIIHCMKLFSMNTLHNHVIHTLSYPL